MDDGKDAPHLVASRVRELSQCVSQKPARSSGVAQYVLNAQQQILAVHRFHRARETRIRGGNGVGIVFS